MKAFIINIIKKYETDKLLGKYSLHRITFQDPTRIY